MMKNLWKGTARQMAGAAWGAALCITGVPGYGGDGRDSAVAANCHCAADSYAIVNLVPGIGYRSRLNTRGQAAFEYVSLDGRLQVGFFDGERMSSISPPGTYSASLGDMNAKGEVGLYGSLQSSTSTKLTPFRWSRAAGWTRLPVLSNDGDTFIGAINDHGFMIGSSGIGPREADFRAVRWSPTNSVVKLATPAGFGESIASDINENDAVVGLAYNAAGLTHAFIWDGAGRPSDLGTLGASEAAGLVNNNRGEIAGWLDVQGPEFQSFLWSPGKGVTRVGRHTVPGELNNAGELIGRIYYPDTGNDHAFLFSRARGLVDLHRSPFTSSAASQADDKGTVVGEMSINLPGAFTQLAYRWARSGEATDLNTRLLDVPDGLVVTQALRISATGDIITNSNAGLLLLRRAGGTDAPVLGPVLMPDEVKPAEPVALSLSFRDRNKGESHSATVDWGDGSGPQAAAISERRGRGALSSAHTYPCAGDYNIIVRVTDSGGRSTWQTRLVNIMPPLKQGIVGEGSLSAEGPRRGQPTLMFRLAAPLAPADARSRPFTFVLQGRVAFQGERLERVSRNGNTVSLEGSGKLNGQPGYRFRVEARDGQHGGAMEADRLAVRIERADAGGNASAAGNAPPVLSYGLTDGKAQAGPAAREGTLPPSALRLIE